MGEHTDWNLDPADDTDCPACAGTGKERNEDDQPAETDCSLCGGEGQVTLRAAYRALRQMQEDR